MITDYGLDLSSGFNSSIHSPKTKSRKTTVVVKTGMETAPLSRSPSMNATETSEPASRLTIVIWMKRMEKFLSRRCDLEVMNDYDEIEEELVFFKIKNCYYFFLLLLPLFATVKVIT